MATIPLGDWNEATDNVGPTDAAISMRVGRHSLKYYLTSPGIDGLQAAVAEILGTVKTSKASPRLTRSLPAASPIFPYFYASAISGIRGIGVPVMTSTQPLKGTVAATPFFLPQPMPFIAVYPTWELTVEFTPRPYAALSDEVVFDNIMTTWAIPPAQGGAGTARQTSRFCEEYIRYTEFDIVPQNDSITGTQGNQIFQTANYPDPAQPGKVGVIGGQPFSGAIKMLLPNQLLRMRWHEVPYSYYMSSNSYLKRFVGYINQLPFFPWAGSSSIFPPGSLLYLGTNPVSYTSPIIQLQPWANGNQSTSRLCTMEMTFLVTSRIAGTTEGGPPATGNANFIAAGHNLLPFFPKKEYHYSVLNSNIAASNQAPPWYSIPFDMLFTNPDFVQTPAIPTAY